MDGVDGLDDFVGVTSIKCQSDKKIVIALSLFICDWKKPLHRALKGYCRLSQVSQQRGRNMNDYDNNKVEIIIELKGREGVAFIEFRKLPGGKPKILKTENFYNKYGMKSLNTEEPK